MNLRFMQLFLLLSRNWPFLRMEEKSSLQYGTQVRWLDNNNNDARFVQRSNLKKRRKNEILENMEKCKKKPFEQLVKTVVFSLRRRFFRSPLEFLCATRFWPT